MANSVEDLQAQDVELRRFKSRLITEKLSYAAATAAAISWLANPFGLLSLLAVALGVVALARLARMRPLGGPSERAKPAIYSVLALAAGLGSGAYFVSITVKQAAELGSKDFQLSFASALEEGAAAVAKDPCKYAYENLGGFRFKAAGKPEVTLRVEPEVFLQACGKLPPRLQRCLAVTYRITHSEECKQVFAELRQEKSDFDEAMSEQMH